MELIFSANACLSDDTHCASTKLSADKSFCSNAVCAASDIMLKSKQDYFILIRFFSSRETKVYKKNYSFIILVTF